MVRADLRRHQGVLPVADLHSLGASEVVHISRTSDLDFDTVIARLHAAGSTRSPPAPRSSSTAAHAIAPLKESGETWLEVMRPRTGSASSRRDVHDGTGETNAERIEHLRMIRTCRTAPVASAASSVDLPAAQQPLKGRTQATSLEYLRMIAVPGCFRQRQPLAGSWLTTGRTSASCPAFGADDLAASCSRRTSCLACATPVNLTELIDLIRGAGRTRPSATPLQPPRRARRSGQRPVDRACTRTSLDGAAHRPPAERASPPDLGYRDRPSRRGADLAKCYAYLAVSLIVGCRAAWWRRGVRRRNAVQQRQRTRHGHGRRARLVRLLRDPRWLLSIGGTDRAGVPGDRLSTGRWCSSSRCSSPRCRCRCWSAGRWAVRVRSGALLGLPGHPRRTGRVLRADRRSGHGGTGGSGRTDRGPCRARAGLAAASPYAGYVLVRAAVYGGSRAAGSAWSVLLNAGRRSGVTGCFGFAHAEGWCRLSRCSSSAESASR